MATAALSPPPISARLKRGLTLPFAAGERSGFLTWLLVWVVVFNAGFALMWIIGAPPRHAEIVLAGAIGLIVRHHLRWLQFLAFVGLLAYSIFSFVAGLFNLSLSSLLASLRFFLELDPSQSIEYMYGAVALLVLTGGAWFALRRRSGFSDNRLVVLAAIAVLGVASLDIWMGTGMRGHYKREAVAGAPFTSAIEQSNAVSAAARAQRNLMVIMVESLGVPVANEEMSRLLFARYHDRAVTDRFELSTGETTYYNSTTAGEIRELCGRWGDYYELLDRTDDGCLPAKLQARGYDSIAYHSFTGDFFERETWYPNIGFDEQVFADRLVEQGTRICGGVFPGACDRDVPKLLAERLKSAEKPQFVYWLTVNSHLPVPPSYNLEVDHCETVSPKLAAELPMICRQFAIWDAVDQALVREITAADFPPTDILIVGDHMPPYFDRHHRKQFAPDRVPWLMLRWRGGEGNSPDLVHGATGQPVRADQG